MEHISVLLEETIAGLNIRDDGIYVDCTLGGGGHSEAVCRRLSPRGQLIGIDQDQYALERAGSRLEPYACGKTYIHDSFFNLDNILKAAAPRPVDGICFDLGVSSFQFDDASRGFSYHQDGPLDMRMNPEQDLTAAVVVNTYPYEELLRILRLYGEERYAPAIARRILMRREDHPFEGTLELAETVKAAYPPKMRFKDKHPARKTFQALRIEVNHELEFLESALAAAVDHLAPQGRLCVITFHSLEDRTVKNFFKTRQNPCTCPPDFPVCVCGKKPDIEIITRKPITPAPDELAVNRRARSAKLRIAEKLQNPGGVPIE
jgi:16S rRNA (cytosine1402-N4)-methyltransferase